MTESAPSFFDPIMRVKDALQNEEWQMLVADCSFVALALLVSVAVGLTVRYLVTRWISSNEHIAPWLQQLARVVQFLAIPAVFLLILTFGKAVFYQLDVVQIVTQIASQVAVAWLIIRIITLMIESESVSRWTRNILWLLAVLHISGIAAPITNHLNSIMVPLGDASTSVYSIIKGLVAFVFFIWIATVIARFIEQRLENIPSLSPSLKVLLNKIIKITLIAIAFLMGLDMLGIDLTALAVFSGALGVGIGFGLQKIISNFVSGIILLSDRSIKPGDVIKVDDTYGWVNALSTRYVSVITRDGKEHLIPNEMLITDKVENWSHSSKNVRLKIPIGISYESDLRKALALIMEVAENNDRVLGNPKPNCLVRSFGDSAIDLELRAWISDPANGVANITSLLLLDIWDSFKENGIEFPYPQQDVHIKSMPVG